ncbi:MAG: hypothetical protein IJD92_02675 [Bacilli bacterium]|nr:hypothetical protein [Bacilli bacterium]
MKKIIDYIKLFFKENYKGLLILLGIFVICNYRLNYSIYTPGGLIDLNDRIVSEDKLYDSNGSINLTYVSLVKGTIPTYLLAKVIPTWDIVKNDDITYDGDIDETIKIDKYYLEESISNAYMVAYNKAGVDYKITNSENYITYVNESVKSNLKLFDKIIKYDNIDYTTFAALQDYISSKNVGDKVIFQVIRDNKAVECYAELIDINGIAKIGISAVNINEYDSHINVDIKSKSSESGSSGGFMTALAIYNSITEKDITKGRKIAGTGTIDLYGNVGEIGGVKYKLSGAVKNKADLMLVPSSNYEEAYQYKKEQGFDIELVSISDFDEAIDFLNNWEG